MDRGILAGYSVVDVEVTVDDGSYHDVDSSEAAFKMAASMAFQAAAKMARPVILEPIMNVQVLVPSDFIGEVTGDLNSRRGRIEAMDERANLRVIDVKVPLSEMFAYATQLRSMTQGRGSFTMEFFAYEPVPKAVEAAIIEGKK